MADKRLIVLSQTDGKPVVFRIAYWLKPVPARQMFYSRIGAVSEWKGASQAENDAIASGAVVEIVDRLEPPAGAGLPEVQPLAESIWTAKQLALDESTAPKRYGSFWDGVTWTVVNI